MMHKLGLHWLKYHQDRRDLEHIERIQYRSIKPFGWMWNNADFCRDLLAVLPQDAYILARDHPLSEQKEGVWHNPEAHGRSHADQWADKVRRGQYRLPVDRSFFLGVNEPNATHGDRDAIDRYTEAYLVRLQAHGLRGGAFNFSTGHPRTVDGTPNTLADYSVFERSHAAIVRGHHIAVAHIYGTGAVPLAPGNYDRLRACTWQDVEWVIGEFGIDEHVIGGGAHVGFHGHFAGRLGDYCGWLDTAIQGIEAIFPYIHSYQAYTFDYSHPWDTFDTRAIREALESYPWQHGQPSRPSGGDVHIPVVSKPGPTQPGQGGSMHNWERAIAWVLNEEGGFQNNPADTGNYYQGKLIGTKYGISAASWAHMYDIPSLTVEQAKDIYYQHYWLASGANKLDWPLCLLVFDTQVLHGMGATWLREVGPNPFLFAAKRQRVYTNMESWDEFGRGWINRLTRLFEELGRG